MQVRPVILCGGVGARLWPLSHSGCPKPFLNLAGEHSLLRRTLARFNRPGFLPPVLIGRAADRALIEAQLKDSHCHAEAILLEPMRRNTAASIAAALTLPQLRADKNSVLLFAPADHLIEDEASFHHACRHAAKGAQKGFLTLLGMRCLYPSTAYGYLQAGERIKGKASSSVSELRYVRHFVEKPDFAKAEQLASDENYFWNSGIFLARPDVLAEELAHHAPKALLTGIRRAMAAAHHESGSAGDLISPPAPEFAALPADSIDYMLLEKSRRLAMLPAAFGWRDIGSWEQIYEILPRDAEGNAAHGPVSLAEAANNCVWADGRPVVLAGVEDLVVVSTPEAVLITRRGNALPAQPQSEKSSAGQEEGLGQVP